MKKFLILALMISVFAASCAVRDIDPISKDSKLAVEAFALAETIREAYIRNDMVTIEKNTTRAGFRTISDVIRDFDSAELTFNPVLVKMEGDIIHLQLLWAGTWQKDGKTTEEMGRTVFILKDRPLKLDSILRTNPFKYPE